MSCNQCFTKFNFFHKEIGCANCGLSFCHKCLKQKIKIPSKGFGEFNVCKSCFAKLQPGSSSTQVIPIPPPDAFINSSPNPSHSSHSVLDFIISAHIRRLELLENPAAPPITVYKQDPKMQTLRAGLSPADQALLDRLEKLKDDKLKKPPPSELEIRRRLAKLKGENNYVEGPSKTYIAPDTRTDQQKSDALLEQFVSEREIQLAQNPENEIEARIATLREKGIRPNEGSYVSNLHDSSGSEDDVDKITNKIMDEVALEDKYSDKQRTSPTSSSLSEDRGSPELPWCVLCNKDAKVRCLDCGGDLYCSECNLEVHKTWGDTDHRVVPYKQK